MFVVLGCVTVVAGITTTLFMPDSPMTARFLADEEKTAILQHVSGNQTGVVNRQFEMKQILEMVLDPQLWLMGIMTTSVGSAVRH